MGKLSRLKIQSLIGAGIAAYGTGAVLMMLGALLVPLAGQFQQMGDDGIVYFFAIIIGAGLGGALLTRIGKVLRRAGVRMRMEDAIIKDAPRVVYLRPFLTDVSASDTAPVDVVKGVVSGLSTHEEHLAEVFAPAGQLIAIAERPVYEEQPLGALRINVNASEWQQHVIELIKSAQLVVLRCGTSPGIAWELRQVLEHCAPERLVMLMSADNEAARGEHALLSAALPHAPPPPGGVWTAHEGLAGICVFDRGWNPRLRLFRSLGIHGSVDAPIVPVLTYALKPVFDTLGIPWGKPPIPLRFRALAAFFGVIAIALAVVAVWIGDGLGNIAGVIAAFAASAAALVIVVGTRTGGLAVIELDSSPIVHPLFVRERNVLRIVNRCTLPRLANLMIIADGHRIAELIPGEREAAVDLAVGRHLLSACLSTQPWSQSLAILCDVPAVGSVTVICSTPVGSMRPRLYLET